MTLWLPSSSVRISLPIIPYYTAKTLIKPKVSSPTYASYPRKFAKNVEEGADILSLPRKMSLTIFYKAT